MAIVFISSKERQKMLILGIGGIILLVLLLIALRVFLVKPKPTPLEWVFKPPKIDINLEVLQSDKVKNLQLIGEIEKEFIYEAKRLGKKVQTGKVSAISQEKAIEILTQGGLSDIQVQEVRPGRENPFIFYEAPPPKTKTKK